MERSESRGALPPIATDLKRIMNAGNEIELYKYPTLGDRIFSQARIADIKERADQKGEGLCILRASSLRR